MTTTLGHRGLGSAGGWGPEGAGVRSFGAWTWGRPCGPSRASRRARACKREPFARHAQGRRLQANAVRRYPGQQRSMPPCAAAPMIARRWSNCAAPAKRASPWVAAASGLSASSQQVSGGPVPRAALTGCARASKSRGLAPHCQGNPEPVATDEARLGCDQPSTGRRRTQGLHQWVFRSIGGGLWGKKVRLNFLSSTPRVVPGDVDDDHVIAAAVLTPWFPPGSPWLPCTLTSLFTRSISVSGMRAMQVSVPCGYTPGC